MSNITQAAIHRLGEFGVVGSLDTEKVIEDVPFLFYMLSEVEENGHSANLLLWKVIAFIGEVAALLALRVNSIVDNFGDAEIELIVSQAAARHPISKELVISIQSLLCYWNRTESIRSVTYRLGNLLVMTGAIAEAINDPDVS